MNALIVGSDPAPLLQSIPNDNFLLIDDGPLIEAVTALGRTGRTFNVASHSFDPLKDMSYRKACDFADVLDAVFPGGDNTLTKQRTHTQIIEGLLASPRSLGHVVKDTKDTADAYDKITRLRLSPVLKNVLERPDNFSLTGTIFARINRAELGDFDAFVLGNLLISQFQRTGTVVMPDFGFYAHQGHANLIREGRLIAGIQSFDQVPELRDHLMLIEHKQASRCTPKDAETLAAYRSLIPGTNEYNDFIATAIGAP